MTRIFSFALILIFLGCASKPLPRPSFSNVQLGAWTQNTEFKGEGIILIPQWHLSPSSTPPKPPVPQETNQLAIYTQLSQWAQAHTFDVLLAEGCEGNINEQTQKKINGWSIEDLKAELSLNHKIDSLLAPIAFKMTAKYSKDIQVTCGDNEKFIKENLLALSNIRGLAGFKLRIEQSTLSEKDHASYVIAATSILHLPKDSAETIVRETLNSEVKKSIEQFEQFIHLRNENFINRAKEFKGIKVIVVGALHISDLKSQLAKKNIPFSVWTPKGIDDQESQLIEQLKAKLKGPS